jgi:hypothetical protein
VYISRLDRRSSNSASLHCDTLEEGNGSLEYQNSSIIIWRLEKILVDENVLDGYGHNHVLEL